MMRNSSLPYSIDIVCQLLKRFIDSDTNLLQEKKGKVFDGHSSWHFPPCTINCGAVLSVPVHYAMDCVVVIGHFSVMWTMRACLGLCTSYAVVVCSTAMPMKKTITSKQRQWSIDGNFFLRLLLLNVIKIQVSFYLLFFLGSPFSFSQNADWQLKKKVFFLFLRRDLIAQQDGWPV